MPADSYSSRLRFRLQATGGNVNTWGALLNAAAIQLVEDSICGLANVPVSTGDVTLSTNNGATDTARMAIINLTGAPTSGFNCIVPALPKIYLVVNNTGQTMTVKTASGTGVAIPAASNQWVACDGTNVFAPQAAPVGSVTNSLQLGGVVAANYARLDIFNAFRAGNATAFANLTDGATITLNAMLSNCFYCLIGGNRTLSITNPDDGQRIEIWFQQDGTGSRTMTWPGTVIFDSGSTGTLSTTPGAIDRFQLTYNAGANIWRARSSIGVATPGTATLNLTSNEMDVNVYLRVGSPGGTPTVNVVIPAGVTIQGGSPATPALDFTGFPSGSTINLTNNGYVLGCGGDGGKGGEYGQSGSSITDETSGANGTDGGPAVKGPGAGINFNIANPGFIWGAGGGGGGGGAAGTGSPRSSNGGGGGGGVGGGHPGFGGTNSSYGSPVNASNGTPGGRGVHGAPGTGGAGNHGGGTTSAGAGGNGGDWGSPGASGTSVGSPSLPGTGGAAGKAIDLNGGSVTFSSGSGGPNIRGSVT
ncbi:MAG TPA: hypothetical protein VLH80_07455 [Nitrospiraceae bacterium]|nr:hypothetical protein [Nitrospiraceae bacterium]